MTDAGGEVDCRVFHSPPPTCPGDQLVFFCSAFDNSDPNLGNTVWTVNPNSVSVSECVLNHIIWPNAGAVCESFQAQASGESPVNCFLSTLNRTASLSLDGIEIVCSFVFGINTPMEVGRERISITGKHEIIIIMSLCETWYMQKCPVLF